MDDSVFDKIFYGTGFGRDRMSAARAGYLLVVWLLIPGFCVLAFQRMMIGLFFTAMLSGMSNSLDAEASFRRPFFTWTGDIGVEDLRIRQNEPDPANPMSLEAKRLRFDLPNLGVMQRALAAAAMDDEEKSETMFLGVLNKVDHIGVHLEGLKYDGITPLPGLLDYVGLATGAPLEAEGCVGDTMWMGSELEKLGIKNEGVDLHLTLANAPEQREVHVIGEIVSPNSSHAEFEQHFPTPGMVAFLDADEGRVANYERLAITDEGFVAKRDAFCAKRDGVAPEEFRERHLASVRRMMQEGGMRPSPEVESVYRQYLEKGNLVLEARPNAKVHRQDYHHYSIADQAMMFNATIAAGGKSVPVRFEEVPSRAIPLEFAGSTWDLVALESRPRGEGEAAAATASAAVASAPAPAAPTAAPAAPPVAPTPALAQASSVTATKPAAAAKPMLEQAPEWAIPHQTTRTTVDGRPLASSKPVAGQTRVRFQPLSFEQLSQHVGDRIALTTIHGARHEGRVESVSGSTLRLRSAPAMGYAITNFERSNIRSITNME